MKRTPFVHIFILICFLINTVNSIPVAQAQASPATGRDFHLPVPGVMVHLSPTFNPPILKGIKVHPDDPFRFDFILDRGDNAGADSESAPTDLKNESEKLIKYFLASLTIPEKDLWVNLSPYEKDRIISNSFGLTEMGRDLLGEDYMLKQITASLIYPEDEVGKRFWKRIYEEAQKMYGTTDIPVNTFNKVWVVPEKAIVYENVKAGTAYVVESKLKVMLEEDYLSMGKHMINNSNALNVLPFAVRNDVASIGANIVREIVIPELTKEVNENKNFARLRQVYNSLILATWYKKKIRGSILAQVYADKNKIVGVSIDDPKEKDKIYQQYLKAFKKGVYNYIKEDADPLTQEMIPRKYFSGGFNLELWGPDKAMTVINKLSNKMIDSFSSFKPLLVTVAIAAATISSFGAGSTNAQPVIGQGTTNAISTNSIHIQEIEGVFLRPFVDLKELQKSYSEDRLVKGIEAMPTDKKQMFLSDFQGKQFNPEDFVNTLLFYENRDVKEIHEMRSLAENIFGFLKDSKKPFSKRVFDKAEEFNGKFGQEWLPGVVKSYPFLFDIKGNLSKAHLKENKDFLKSLPAISGKDSLDNLKLLRLYHIAIINVYANMFDLDQNDYVQTIFHALVDPQINQETEIGADSSFDYNTKMFFYKDIIVGAMAHESAHNFLFLGTSKNVSVPRSISEFNSDALALALLNEVYGKDKADLYEKFMSVSAWIPNRSTIKGAELLTFNDFQTLSYVAGDRMKGDPHYQARRIYANMKQAMMGQMDPIRMAKLIMDFDNKIRKSPLLANNFNANSNELDLSIYYGDLWSMLTDGKGRMGKVVYDLSFRNKKVVIINSSNGIVPKRGQGEDTFRLILPSFDPINVLSIKQKPLGQSIMKKNDQAMKAYGGIDLTHPERFLKTTNDGGVIKFIIDPVMFRKLQNSPGFVPGIIHIQPLKNLKLFLGVDV